MSQLAAAQRALLLQGFDELQLLPVIVGHLTRLAVAGDHSGCDQHDQLGAVLAFAGVAKQPTQTGHSAQLGHGRNGIAVVLFDQAAEQYRLPALHRDLG